MSRPLGCWSSAAEADAPLPHQGVPGVRGRSPGRPTTSLPATRHPSWGELEKLRRPAPAGRLLTLPLRTRCGGKGRLRGGREARWGESWLRGCLLTGRRRLMGLGEVCRSCSTGVEKDVRARGRNRGRRPTRPRPGAGPPPASRAGHCWTRRPESQTPGVTRWTGPGPTPSHSPQSADRTAEHGPSSKQRSASVGGANMGGAAAGSGAVSSAGVLRMPDRQTRSSATTLEPWLWV